MARPSPVWNPLSMLLVLFLLASPALADLEVVAIRTPDGLELAGDLYSTGASGAPAVVALHMYRSDRQSWASVAKPLNDAGIDLLAIDLRGHGGSAIQGEDDFSGRVADRDPILFNEMWQDALAAMDFLVARGSDPRRIAFLGASVGCSVAIDAAVRREAVRGVLLMTPGLGYLGVPTSQHMKEYGARPMKILCSTEEAGGGTTAIEEAVGPTCSVDLFDQPNSHGTRMFRTMTGVEERIANWFRIILAGEVALDGEFSQRELKGFGLRSKIEVDGTAFEAFAHRRGAWLHVVLTGPPEKFPPRFLVAFAGPRMLPEATAIVRTENGVAIQNLIYRDGSFAPVRTRRSPSRADPGAAKGTVLELLIPLTRIDVGFDPRGGFRLAFAFGAAEPAGKLTWFGTAKPDDVKTWLAWPGK